MSKRKPMTGVGKTIQPDDTKGLKSIIEEADQGEKQTKPKMASQPQETKRATFYIEPEHHNKLDMVKIRLRRMGKKADKSLLVRRAIDLLFQQDEERLGELFE